MLGHFRPVCVNRISMIRTILYGADLCGLSEAQVLIRVRHAMLEFINQHAKPPNSHAVEEYEEVMEAQDAMTKFSPQS